MQTYGERVALLDGELAELRQRLPKVHARIGVVEDEIEEVQHALQDLELPIPADAAERELQKRHETRAWLRQEKLRLGQREDRIRQEKANLMQLQLRLLEAKLQTQLHTDAEYHGAVRLIPPCLILLFLSALAAWFGFDLLHNQPGLTTTQKVASIGSATFTVMTIVALFVRAAMCTGEWQWTLHACYCITGWYWLKPMSQHRLQHHYQQHRPSQSDAASFTLDKAPSIPQPPASEAASADNFPMEDESSSPRSVDGSEFEDIKKQS